MKKKNLVIFEKKDNNINFDILKYISFQDLKVISEAIDNLKNKIFIDETIGNF